MAGSVGSIVTAQKAAKLQSLNGLFAVYKKQGPTSADVLNVLKEKLLQEANLNHNAKKRKRQTLKIGHGGTLDSAASGVLVVGIGKGTKMLGTMLTGSKKYTTVGELGKATDTLDATGAVTKEMTYEHITKEDFEAKLKKFTGNIMQVPPLQQAYKHGENIQTPHRKCLSLESNPRHDSCETAVLANIMLSHICFYSNSVGIQTDRRKRNDRNNNIHTYLHRRSSVNLSLQDFSPPFFTLIKHGNVFIADVECGGGFYVRSLVDDLGKELSSCAHVKELVRTKQGPFVLEEHVLREERWTIDDIAQSVQDCSHLLNTEAASKKPKIDLGQPPATHSDKGKTDHEEP
ncbi:TRUB1 synthase, partial [Atractosteus spatula]|nr:TRUB1 synthase [Atractosteus spatula]